MRCRAANEKIASLQADHLQSSTIIAELKSTLESERSKQEDIFEYLRGEIHNKNMTSTRLTPHSSPKPDPLVSSLL